MNTTIKRPRSIIVKSLCKTYLLDFAARNRSHKFTRVSSKVYDYLEAKTRENMQNIVNSHPSKGKTISI